MESKAIFLPVCAQVFVTFLVWIWLYVTRIGAMKKNHVRTQDLADADYSARVLKDAVNPSDNFENLFELPILFYVAAIVIAVAGLTDSVYVYAAWTFVALRALHSFIHCAYNTVMHRFTAYALGAVVLWAMWARIAIQLSTG